MNAAPREYVTEPGALADIAIPAVFRRAPAARPAAAAVVHLVLTMDDYAAARNQARANGQQVRQVLGCSPDVSISFAHGLQRSVRIHADGRTSSV